MSNQLAVIGVSEIGKMADAVAKSGLFGMKKPEEAMALMLIAQAEGTHPALAVRDYHIIQGKPALKADAMMARFQQAGGRVEWHKISDEEVSATFSHPSGGSAPITWTKEDAVRAGFWGKDNWKKFPRQMLRARVISEGIRTVFPGVVIGVYTPEEVQDFDDRPIKDMGRAEVMETKKAAPEITKEQSDMRSIAEKIREDMKAAKTIQELNSVWVSNKPVLENVKTFSAAAHEMLEKAFQKLMQNFADAPIEGEFTKEEAA